MHASVPVSSSSSSTPRYSCGCVECMPKWRGIFIFRRTFLLYYHQHEWNGKEMGRKPMKEDTWRSINQNDELLRHKLSGRVCTLRFYMRIHLITATGNINQGAFHMTETSMNGDKYLAHFTLALNLHSSSIGEHITIWIVIESARTFMCEHIICTHSNALRFVRLFSLRQHCGAPWQ